MVSVQSLTTALAMPLLAFSMDLRLRPMTCGCEPFRLALMYLPWWSGTSSHSLMAARIGGMALWRFAVRCAEMDSRRRRLLSGVMVTPMAEWPDKIETSL